MMEVLKPNNKRAKNAILLIWVVLGIEILILINQCFQYKILHSIHNDDYSELNRTNDFQFIISIIHLVVSLFSAITFIQWFRRAYYNLHTKIEGLYYSENWAALCWFLPIASLYRPYKIMKELYKETEILLTENIENYTPKTTTHFLSWWWSLWILTGLMGQYLNYC